MKWFPMVSLALTVSLALLSEAWAGDAILTWTAPTQNEDGTPLVDLAGFKIYGGQAQGGPYPVTIDVPDPLATTFTVPNLTDGLTYFFVTTAYNSASEVQESAWSNEVSKTIPFPIPNPPGMLTVAEVVYSVSKGDDMFLLAAVGRAALGVPCDSTQYVRGINETEQRYVVPVDEVYMWFGSVRSEVVVGHCAPQ